MEDDELPNEHYEKAEQVLKSSVSLLTGIKQARKEIREKSKQVYGTNLLDAHMMVTGVLQEALSRKSLVPGDTSKSIANRRVLIASFIQGISICEEAITEGMYIQAAALVRQELETVAAIEEVVENQREEGKTPNVKHVSWEMNRLYGELSKATHVSEHEYLAEIYQVEAEGEARPVSIYPTFRDESARNLYAIHVGLLIQIAMHLHELQVESYGEGEGLRDYELKLVMSAAGNLSDAGLLEENGDE